jgi:hypothetical protein
MTALSSTAHAEKKSVNHIHPSAFGLTHRNGGMGI